MAEVKSIAQGQHKPYIKIQTNTNCKQSSLSIAVAWPSEESAHLVIPPLEHQDLSVSTKNTTNGKKAKSSGNTLVWQVQMQD